jgi:hypothetical protein
LVTTHLRFVEDAETDIYIDRVQRCWVSWDLQRETWVDSTTRRDGKLRTGSVEVAIRQPPSTASPRGELLIIRQDDAHGTRDTYTLVPTTPWLPRGLRWLIRDVLEPSTSSRAAWHTWDETTMTPRITIRRDAADGPRVTWSWLGRDGLPTALTAASDGSWKRASRPDGTIIERSDEDTVTRRWQDAGLRLR